ncbi:MAG TPA: penicillin-binding protein 2 [Desulfatiglandales bacterium]|nr:penicillin-binding protein 2 [Desulfatiglandales bacterium]
MVWRSDFDLREAEIYQRRLTRLTVFVFVVFGILFVRLWSLQIIHGSRYRTESENNRIDLRDIMPSRGLVFDRNGQLLVDNRPSFILGVMPENIRNLDSLLSDLSRLVDIDRPAAEEKIKYALRGDPFRCVYLKRGLSRDELARIETHKVNMPGVTIEVKPQRHCIYGTLAAHLIGYLGEIDKEQLGKREYGGNKPGDFVGKYGIEKKWHKYLDGTRGGQQVEVDASGRILRVLYQKEAEAGADVYLTIDKDLQVLAEQSLKNRAGAIVAMSPKSGEILAAASSPTFNPNDFAKGMDKGVWQGLISHRYFPLQNRVISSQYPPGSLFKIVVALAGLEEGGIDPKERLFCGGSYTFQGREYRDWKKEGHGYVDLHRALVESCDVYFYRMGQRIGIEAIAKYAKNLGLGHNTGIQLGDEKPGLIPNKAWKLRRWHVPWQDGETLSVAVGQSFTLITPIQIARFISALFNGGTLYRPQATLWVGRDSEKRLFEFKPEPAGTWDLAEKNMELVKRGLYGVVNEPHGTGWRARLPNIPVAGKTGTSQVISLPEERETGQEKDIPYKFRDHAWFVAIAPFEDPQIAVAIVVEHSGKGGAVAAPIAKALFEEYFKTKAPS